MQSVAKTAILAATLGTAALASTAASAEKVGTPKPTVVLVHGAFADGSTWSRVIPVLQAKGLKVVAVQNPLTSLAADVAATRRVLAKESGPVVLVGHSYGGVVITEAGQQANVKALVYVAAYAPSEGQSIADLNKDYPTPSGFSHIVADNEGFLTLTEEGVSKHLAQDVEANQTSSPNAHAVQELRRQGLGGSLEDTALLVRGERERPHAPARPAARNGKEDSGKHREPSGRPCTTDLEAGGSCRGDSCRDGGGVSLSANKDRPPNRLPASFRSVVAQSGLAQSPEPASGRLSDGRGNRGSASPSLVGPARAIQVNKESIK